MFDFLNSLRDRLDPLVRLGRSGNTARFIAALFEAAQLYVVSMSAFSLDLSEAPPDAPDTGDKLAALMEAAAKESSSDEPMKPYTLDHGEVECLPLFSNPRAAESFIKTVVMQQGRIVPFQILCGTAADFLPSVAAYDRVILNPGTAASYEFSPADIDALRAAVLERERE